MATNSVKNVYNLILLDESGSMQSIKEPVINGFNEIMQSIRNSATHDPELRQWINFWSFNGLAIKEMVPLSVADKPVELDKESYRPNDSTPLFDAIGKACNALLEKTAGDKDAAFLITIFTDGEENSSREYAYEAIAGLVKELRSKGWIFTFIGASPDVERTAMSIHISNAMYFQTTREGVSDFVAKDTSSRSRLYEKLKKQGRVDPDEPYFDNPN